MALKSFDEVMKSVQHASKKHLLLGNGFSIALRPDIFTYGSLFENADFSKNPHIPAIFDALGTKDFEIVIRALNDAARIIEVADPKNNALAMSLRNDCGAIKDALVSAVAKRHPDRPHDVQAKQYAACRAFLSRFDHIFTLNYDVLLYWAMMQSEVDELDLMSDDGFRHPEDDPYLPYVSWQQANSAKVLYLHGALHLFDQGNEIVKYTWSKADKAIIDQIREALDGDKFPLFVSEGTAESKAEKILHNGYLHKAIRSFESCCNPANNAIVIFGHSLADNDRHILRCISSGAASTLLVGLYGDIDSDGNRAAMKNAEALVSERVRKRPRAPLKVMFYDAASAAVWG